MAENQNLTKQSNQSNDTALYDAIAKGLALMLARNMRFMPDRKDIGRIAGLLTQDLIAVGKTDPQKVTDALAEIGRTDDEWPSTARIIRELKPSQHGATRLGFPMLGHSNKEPTDEEKQNFRKIIAEAKKGLPAKKPETLTKSRERELLDEAREKFKELNK